MLLPKTISKQETPAALRATCPPLNRQATGRNFRPGPGSDRVLLSDEMKVTSTVLKITVDDLTTARTRAASLAAGVGAATQVFPEQTSGKQCW